MDTAAHRIIKQARDILVDDLLGYHRDLSLSAEQTEEACRLAEGLWRLMADDPAPPECQECATPLIQAATGRPRRFCSDTCRSKGRA